MTRFIALIIAFLSLSAFSLQPMDERSAQDKLPQAGGMIWLALSGTTVDFDEKTGLYSASFSDGVKEMVGKKITLQGFMLPLESTEKFKHFILSKRTPTCFFCPPGTPSEIIEVFSNKAASWDEGIVTVAGTFSLVNNQEMGMFFKLDQATVSSVLDKQSLSNTVN